VGGWGRVVVATATATVAAVAVTTKVLSKLFSRASRGGVLENGARLEPEK